jgi:hypothetical protein
VRDALRRVCLRSPDQRRTEGSAMPDTTTRAAFNRAVAPGIAAAIGISTPSASGRSDRFAYFAHSLEELRHQSLPPTERLCR